MAQNECQQMLKPDFYANLRNQISTIYNHMSALKRLSEFLSSMDQDTATAMTISSEVQTDMNNLRTAITELLDFYEGTATSQTKVLKGEINKLRYISNVS